MKINLFGYKLWIHQIPQWTNYSHKFMIHPLVCVHHIDKDNCNIRLFYIAIIDGRLVIGDKRCKE